MEEYGGGNVCIYFPVVFLLFSPALFNVTFRFISFRFLISCLCKRLYLSQPVLFSCSCSSHNYHSIFFFFVFTSDTA